MLTWLTRMLTVCVRLLRWMVRWIGDRSPDAESVALMKLHPAGSLPSQTDVGQARDHSIESAHASSGVPDDCDHFNRRHAARRQITVGKSAPRKVGDRSSEHFRLQPEHLSRYVLRLDRIPPASVRYRNL